MKITKTNESGYLRSYRSKSRTVMIILQSISKQPQHERLTQSQDFVISLYSLTNTQHKILYKLILTDSKGYKGDYLLNDCFNSFRNRSLWLKKLNIPNLS